MSFVRSYGFVFYFALFFWTVDLLAMGQADDDKIVRIPPSISYIEPESDIHEEKTGKGDFALLPHETILLIFEFLSHRELGRLASVSRAMKQLSEDDFVWRSIAAKRGLPISSDNSGLISAGNSVLPSVKQMFWKSLRRAAWVEKFRECR